MGYCSDGGIVIYGPKDKMLSHLTMLRMTPEVANVWKENHHTIFDKGDFTVWHFEYSGWKWYPDYEDIQAYEKLWDLSCEAPRVKKSAAFGGDSGKTMTILSRIHLALPAFMVSSTS